MDNPVLTDTFKNPLPLLKKNGKLMYILHKAQQLQAFNQIVQQVIQAPHIYVLNLNDKTLFIGANNASMASRIRILTPQIKHAFATKGIDVQKIKVSIFLRPLRPQAAHQKPHPISPNARKTLDTIYKLLD